MNSMEILRVKFLGGRNWVNQILLNILFNCKK